MKQEMHYGEPLLSYEFDDYINKERIKQKLAGLSPVQYRTQNSQTAA